MICDLGPELTTVRSPTSFYQRRRAARDRFLRRTRIEHFDGRGHACVQVPLVSCILGYHWRYYELARASDLFFGCVWGTWYSEEGLE
jgi:hypothetical protein